MAFTYGTVTNATVVGHGVRKEYEVRLGWQLNSQSIENNSSNISLRLEVRSINSNYQTYGFYQTSTIGSQTFSAQKFDMRPSGEWKVFATRTYDVQHNNDGTYSAERTGSFTTDATIDWTLKSGSASVAYTLPTIPRATTAPNIDGYIESDAPFVITPASTNFKHRLYYEYNGITGYYPNETEFFTTNGSISLDKSFYEKTPKSSGTGTITLYTYDADGNLIGSSQSTLTVRCDKEKCKPLIEFDVVDINPITSQLTAGTDTSDIIVKGYSNVQITYEIETRNSATLKSKTVNNTPLGDSPFVINNVATSEFDIVAIDSRDFDTTETKSLKVVNYIPLAIALNAFRTSPTGSEIKVNFSGNYFNDTFGVVENELELSWKYRELRTTNWIDGGTLVEGTDYTITEDNKFYSGTGAIASNISLSTELFKYNKAYEVAIFYKDKIIGLDGTLYTSKSVPKGKPVFNWEDELFNVNGELTINEKNILESFYPIGSIYISTNETNPQTLFGGTWEQIKDTFLLGAGDTYNAGATGGEAEHTLTIEEMPSHTHKQFNRNWYVTPQNTQTNTAGNADGEMEALTSATGGGQAHNNMPPYLTVYMWKRIA